VEDRADPGSSHTFPKVRPAPLSQNLAGRTIGAVSPRPDASVVSGAMLLVDVVNGAGLAG
jgi:hypothetical protein